MINQLNNLKNYHSKSINRKIYNFPLYFDKIVHNTQFSKHNNQQNNMEW